MPFSENDLQICYQTSKPQAVRESDKQAAQYFGIRLKPASAQQLLGSCLKVVQGFEPF